MHIFTSYSFVSCGSLAKFRFLAQRIIGRLTEQENDARDVLLDWIETGAPVKPPVRRGFGSALIESCFGSSNSVVKYNPEGLTEHFQIRL